MEPAPVVIFAYNRPVHLQRLLASISKVQVPTGTKIYCFLDGPKAESDLERTEAARQILVEWLNALPIGDGVLIARDRNFGLSRNVILGVDEVLLSHDKVIVLEDDLEVSGDFFGIMNHALLKYQNSSKIASVSGYIYPVDTKGGSDFFLLKRPSSWGWATWKDRWSKVDWEVSDYAEFVTNRDQRNSFNIGGADLTPMLIKWKKGLNDSWAVRWAYHHYKTKSYSLFPKWSMVSNTGNDGSGIHSPATSRFDQIMVLSDSLILPDTPAEDRVIAQRVVDFFEPSMLRKVINHFLFKFKPDVR